jgi:hypothetical protein
VPPISQLKFHARSALTSPHLVPRAVRAERDDRYPARIAATRGSSRSNDLGVLAKNHVGRFWRGHVLGASVTKLEHVDIREELLARPEEDW